MLAWLNSNQGAALVIITLLYTITTIFILRAMARANRMTTELERRRSRPYVIFDIQDEDQVFFAVLRNIGISPALNLQLVIAPPLKVLAGNEDRESSLVQPIAFLAPGRILKDYIGVSHKFFKQDPIPVYKGELRYEDAAGTAYIEPFIVDVRFQARQLVIRRNYDLLAEVKRLRQAVESIDNKLSRREDGD